MIDLAKFINSGAYANRKYCLLVTLDIKNAYNSAPWKGTVKALSRKNISPYIIRIVKSYLSERRLFGEGVFQVICGVPLGLVLGLTLCNFFYDKVLGLAASDSETIRICRRSSNSHMGAQFGSDTKPGDWYGQMGFSLAEEKRA